MSRSTLRIRAVAGNVDETCERRAWTSCSSWRISTFQSKNKLISDEPRAVFDLIRAMPGMPFIASSIGFVTETSVCVAGASPLSAMITMRGKSVWGKTAIGSRHAAYSPATQSSATMTKIARD